MSERPSILGGTSRRIAAVGVSAAAAITLSVVPATAQEGSLPGGSIEDLGGSVEGSLGDLAPGSSAGDDGLYTGQVEVVDGEAEDPEVLTGRVFDDANENSRIDGGEAGVPGVSVSNGVDVVQTDEEGRYELPVRGDFTAFVTQPAGWQVPVDEENFAQFSYNHYPEGSPELEFGGLEPTGDTPAAVNFPMARSEATADPQQSCAIAADTQAYDEEEVEFARQGAVADLMARDDYAGCGIMLLGDNVGDDLSLNPDVKDIYADANGPVRAVPGNHDMDFDAEGYENSVDTYRRDFGAPYYSYDVGETHFVGLFNVMYNGADDDGGNGGYTEAIAEEQLEWLRNDLANVDEGTPVVVAAHAPIVNYSDVVTDNAAELYEILADHPDAVTIGGHTHTLEHLLAGDQREEWAAAGIDELSHDQIVAGAVSGSWYSGELNEDGVPHAYTSDGAEPGVLTMEFDGTERSEYYTVRGEEQDKQFLTGLNSPTWREWAAEAQQWQDDDKDGEGPGPMEVDSVSLEDVRSGESWVSSSFFGGSTGAEVLFSLDGAEATEGTLTQPMTGEALNKGWEFTEPVSATPNLSSTGAGAQASPHLWRADLPTDLEPGEHTVEVTATDRYGATYTDSFTFTVEDGNGADDADDADDGEAAGETDSE